MHTFAAKNRLCTNTIGSLEIIFCKYVEISVDNIINIFVLQILFNLFLYFNCSDRNGLYAKQTSLFFIVTQHSNSHVHEDLKFKFSIVKVISSVVNMTSGKYNVLEVSIFLQSKIKRHWVRLYVTDCIDMSYVEFLNFLEFCIYNRVT